LRVTLGSDRRSQQTTYPVSRVVVDPWWNWDATTGPGGQLGDLALLGGPVRLPERPATIAPTHVGQALTVLGWGYTTKTPPGPVPDELQRLTVTEIPSQSCANADPAITAGEFCINDPGEDSGRAWATAAQPA
jgi:hypothetical protein